MGRGAPLKRSLSAHLMQVKLLLVTFYLNGRLHAVSIRKLSERMSNFWTVQFLETESKLNFHFPHIPSSELFDIHSALVMCCINCFSLKINRLEVKELINWHWLTSLGYCETGTSFFPFLLCFATGIVPSWQENKLMFKCYNDLTKAPLNQFVLA